MIEHFYAYYLLTDLIFAFHSEGVKGKILKIIIFTLKEDGKWNLAFGDWKNNRVNDSIMTNNQDVVKVIGTVAKATYEFFDKHPNAILEIKPIDEKRKKLYNIVFQRHFRYIENNFQIFGYIQGQKEIYSPEKLCDSFELSLKHK